MASAECRDLFVSGHYYGCISLAQAVAEGLSTFLAAANRQRRVRDPHTRVKRLADAKLISGEALDAFLRIWGEDRNDYHHLNPSVETDRERLAARALECVDDLYAIESDVFAFGVQNGGIVPRYPQYWPGIETGYTQAFVRFV